MTDPILRPCGFCGGEDLSIEWNLTGDTTFSGTCRTCGAMGPAARTPELASAAWNRRAGKESE